MGTTRRLIITMQAGRSAAGTSMPDRLERHARKTMIKMFSTRMLNTLRLTIKLRKSANCLAKRTYRGQAHWRDMTRSVTARSKHYTVIVKNTGDLPQMLQTLTHEIAHVAQMAHGRLAVRHTKSRGWEYYWRPAGHTGASQRYPMDCTYWTRPWEVEARKAAGQR